LQIEELQVGARRLPGDAAQLAQGVPLTVPAAEPGWLQFRVEAVQAGADVLRVVVEFAHGRQEAAAACEVLADEPVAGTPGVKVHRTLERIVLEYARFDAETGEPSAAGPWRVVRQPVPYVAGSPINPGDRILVREEITLPQPLDGVIWTQRVPPTCHALQTGPGSGRVIGELARRRVDQLRYVAPSLPAGRHVHEYELVAVRPGACTFPPPEVSAIGPLVPVRVEPAETRVHVTGP
jgi:hypothetical protein